MLRNCIIPAAVMAFCCMSIGCETSDEEKAMDALQEMATKTSADMDAAKNKEGALREEPKTDVEIGVEPFMYSDQMQLQQQDTR